MSTARKSARETEEKSAPMSLGQRSQLCIKEDNFPLSIAGSFLKRQVSGDSLMKRGASFRMPPSADGLSYKGVLNGKRRSARHGSPPQGGAAEWVVQGLNADSRRRAERHRLGLEFRLRPGRLRKAPDAHRHRDGRVPRPDLVRPLRQPPAANGPGAGHPLAE